MQRLAFACCALLFVAHANARVSGSVALNSDYRFRGVTLSDGLPAAQFDIDWADPQGWYAGAFVSSVRLAPRYEVGEQWLGYAGYAQRIDANWNWEAGAVYAGFARDHEYDYPEIHFGIVSAALQMRVHYARHYFGRGPAALYAEVDDTHELTDRWRVLGHVGVLRREGATIDGDSHYRYDARVGLDTRLGAFDLQLALVDSTGSAFYVFGYPSTKTSQRNVVLSVSRTW